MSDQISTRKPRNEFNEAMPQIFNREGLVKKHPLNNRPSPRDFVRIMAKVQKTRAAVIENDHGIVIEMPIGDLYLDQGWSRKIALITDNEEQPDLVAALLLNGWKVSAE